MYTFSYIAKDQYKPRTVKKTMNIPFTSRIALKSMAFMDFFVFENEKMKTNIK